MMFLGSLQEQAYALLRIFSGLMFFAHGVQKLFGFPDVLPYPMTPLIISAGVIELVAGGLIVVGFFAGPAAFVASGMAAVGYWIFHAPESLFPIMNNGETIALYCFVFLFISARGAGIWSLESVMKSRGRP